MLKQFARTGLIFGTEGLDRLENARVAVFGIGGVGGHIVEALARSGIGALDLIDNDIVSITNINRQIIATMSSIGKYKVDVAKERILDINPACRIKTYRTFFMPETAGNFDFSQYDYVIDAIDTVVGKLSLIEETKKSRTPIICAMGAGNKMNPAKFEVADISKTSVCPLARVIRQELKKRKIKNVKVVFSNELPIAQKGKIEETTNKHQLPGSNAFCPSVMGLIIASEVIKDLIND